LILTFPDAKGPEGGFSHRENDITVGNGRTGMAVDVGHDEEGCLFKVYVDGEEAGYLSYNMDAGTLDIEHTAVDPLFRGRGLGRMLVEAALEYAGSKRVEVRPFCSYARALMKK
jgi:predicted GNAT family acetyltransferase